MASHFTQPYNPTIQNNPNYSVVPQQMAQLPYYNFPQLSMPAGSVYATNTIQEANNVPVGMGTTVALCLPENFMLIKTAQNGIPIIKQYSITEIQQKTTTDLEKENQALAQENQKLKDSLAALQSKTNEGGAPQWQL